MKKPFIHLIFLLMSIGVLPSTAALGDEPKQLVSLRKAYADAHVEALEPLTKKYFQALASLKKKLSQAGDLEGAIIVESEEKGTNKTPEKDQPRQLVRLNRIYESSREKKSLEVTGKYIKALQVLQIKLTKSGDLEGAKKVREEYKKYVTVKQDASGGGRNQQVKFSKRQIEKILTSGNWEWRASHEYSGKPDMENVQFGKDGSCNIDWIWKWEIVDSSNLKIHLHDRTYLYFEMDFVKKRGKTNVEKTTFKRAGKQRASMILKR